MRIQYILHEKCIALLISTGLHVYGSNAGQIQYIERKKLSPPKLPKLRKAGIEVSEQYKNPLSSHEKAWLSVCARTILFDPSIRAIYLIIDGVCMLKRQWSSQALLYYIFQKLLVSPIHMWLEFIK